MKYQYLLMTLVAMLSFGSCKDDKEGSLSIHFKALYDGQPLPTFSTRPFDPGQQLQFTHLSTLISDLELLHHSSTELLSEIELVDLSFDVLAQAEEGYIVTFTNIPARTYTGIRFGVGVPADVNLKVPADFPSSSPLSKTGYYWTAWDSYIFTKIEGRLDTLGSGALDLGFAMHTGSDPLYRIAEGTLPISIDDGKTATLTINIDYKKLLQDVNIKVSPQNHNPADTVQLLEIVNNLPSSLSLSQ